VLLIGGTSRIPHIGKMLQKAAGGYITGLDPESGVCEGACILSGIFNGLYKDRLLLDVTPASYSVGLLGDVASVLIPRNSTIPTKKSESFTTIEDNQTELTVRIFQGERPLTSQNIYVGQVRLTGLAPAKSGTPAIEVCFDINAQGTLCVSATDRATRRNVAAVLESPYRLNPAQIKVLRRKVQKEIGSLRDADINRRNAEPEAEARTGAARFSETIANFVQEFGDRVPNDSKGMLNSGRLLVAAHASNENWSTSPPLWAGLEVRWIHQALAVLSLTQGHFLGGAKLTFFPDIETHIRFLVSLPVLILAEMIVHQRIRPVVKGFVERRVVAPEELPKFYAAIDSAMRIRNSVIVEVVLLILVYTVGTWIWRHQVALEVASWYASPHGGQMHLTLAGYWFAFVSVPVFQFILLRWYMRILIWFWFLLRVSRLTLHLVPAHPDRAGGLGFLGTYSFALAPLLFAQGALLAGQIASRIFYNGQSLLAFKMTIAGFVVFFVVVVLAPLFLFTPQLARARIAGLAEYGALASTYVMDFDQKWLRNKVNAEQLLGTADIQSLADLGNSFAVIREMRPIPFSTNDVVRLLVATVAPLVPLLLTIMPLERLVTQVVKIIF
jgi:hypothetical protein